MKINTTTALDYCEFVTDGTHDSPKAKDEGFKLITSKHLKRYEIDFNSANFISEEDYKKVIDRSGVEQWDILFSMIGTIGNLYIETNSNINYACKNMGIFQMGGDEMKSKWLYYYLQSPKAVEYIAAVSRGTTQGYVPLGALRKMPVDVVENIVRDKIVTFLWNLDEKIKTNIEINNNLEQQAQAIFANEFLSLDTLPEGWKQASLIDIADYINGLAMQKYRPTADENGIPVLKIKELRQGFCDDNSELCSPSIKSDYIIHDGDVIFSWSGSLLVDLWCGGICGLNQHLFKVTSSKYDKWFYYAWTKHHLDHFVAVAADKATTMGHIKRDELAKAGVLIPNETDYDRIGALLQPVYEMIISNRIENKKLAATRDTLLPKLMNGEIDMSEVDYE